MNPQATRRLAATFGLAFLALLPACAYHGPYESYPAPPVGPSLTRGDR